MNLFETIESHFIDRNLKMETPFSISFRLICTRAVEVVISLGKRCAVQGEWARQNVKETPILVQLPNNKVKVETFPI